MLAAALLFAAGIGAVQADNLNLNGEFLYTTTDGKVTLKDTGRETSSNLSRFDQRYNLDISKEIYPYLTIAGGSYYELDKSVSTNEGQEFDIRDERVQPFIDLNLNNPMYQAGVSYRNSTLNEDITDLPTNRSSRDQYTAVMGMNSTELLPKWNFSFTRLDTTSNPVTLNQEADTYNFSAQYDFWRQLTVDYEYTLNDTKDFLRDSETKDQTHFGHIDYAKNFLDDRLSLNTGYRIRYNTFDISNNATTEEPLLRFAGLSSQDNTPEDGPALASTQTLIDGNTTASTGLDLGLGGDESTLTNIGLDFGFPTDVDQIQLWVDRRLSTAIANAFTWSVYSSPDNLDGSTWTLVASVAQAPFGTFDNRFEIRFPAVHTRFIKVVTRPLLPATPDASQYANIFVTEMEAFITKTSEQSAQNTTTVYHNYNLNLQSRLGKQTIVGYNLLHSRQTQDPLQAERTMLTNDVFMNHIFNSTYSSSANVQRTDNNNSYQQTSVDYSYGASLRAAWLATLNQALTYSGRSVFEDQNATQDSVFLRTNAILYKGWSMFLDLGYGWDKLADGTRDTSKMLRSGTSLTPSEKLTLNSSYSYKLIEPSEPDTESQVETQYDIQGFFLLFPNLSLFAKMNVVERSQRSDTFQNYSINWSPFPQGDLQFSFLYSEVLRPETDQIERVIGPSARWTIGRHILMNVYFTQSETEDTIQKSESRSMNMDVKLLF